MVNETNLLFSMYVASGTLSIIGSSSILYLIYLDRKTRNKDKINNYMLVAALSVFDIILSFVLGYGWNFYPDGEHPWAQGNYNTCVGHTFLLTLGLASTYYNGSLAVYYVLVVKHGKSAEWMYKWAMPALVGLPAIHAITMTATCMSLGSYGFDGEFCGWCGWVDDNAALGWVASWGPICLSFLVVLVCMAILVHAIYTNEKKMRDRYDFSSQPVPAQSRSKPSMQSGSESLHSSATNNAPQQQQQRNRIAKLKMTRKMSIQAMLYIGAFFTTYAWSFIAMFMNAYSSREVPFFVWVLRALFQPSQGLLNFIIFYRGYSKGDQQGRKKTRNTSIRRKAPSRKKNTATLDSNSNPEGFLWTTTNRSETNFNSGNMNMPDL